MQFPAKGTTAYHWSGLLHPLTCCTESHLIRKPDRALSCASSSARSIAGPGLAMQNKLSLIGQWVESKTRPDRPSATFGVIALVIRVGHIRTNKTRHASDGASAPELRTPAGFLFL